MNNQYINVPTSITIHDICSKEFSLSATQYKTLNIKNKNCIKVQDFLYRNLKKSDLGEEVGSEVYTDNSDFFFIKTKALQEESYILNIDKKSFQNITPQSYKPTKLNKDDLLISKDSNVGEIVILDKDYPHTMLCGGIYKLPIIKKKYYLLAFIKHQFFRQQIDFLIPRGSTIRHGKTKFLDCIIPLPNSNIENTINYIEQIVQAIIHKEILIKERHNQILLKISQELKINQNKNKFKYDFPTIQEIMKEARLDASLYSEEIKQNEFLISNYYHGYSSIQDLGFTVSRGQNLQISNIGFSIYSNVKHNGFYTLILPKNISEYGTISKLEYLGNKNKLLCMKQGDIIFGAEGTFRSFVNIDNTENTITNIHGITIKQKEHNLNKGIFLKLILDYYFNKNMTSTYAVGGNGGSLAIQYLDYIKIPNFNNELQNNLIKLYYNPTQKYESSYCTLETFLTYDDNYNNSAGIYDLNNSIGYLQEKLDQAIHSIINDIEVEIKF